MRILGVDGCRLGWIGILFFENEEWNYSVSTSIKELISKFKPDVCLIDIPIVLSKNESARECDISLRKILPRNYKSSVFNPPVKSALRAVNYTEACNINQTITGKKISLQTWYIMPKIREVVEFLSNNTLYSSKLYEAHPETFFFRLNHESALNYKKKTIDGRAERLSILNRIDNRAPKIFEIIKDETMRKHLAYDDIVDALSLATAGSKFFPVEFEMLPKEPISDYRGTLQNVFIPKKLSQ